MNKAQKTLVALKMLGGKAPIPTYTISGTVFESDGETPVEGATIALLSLSTLSGADGTYTLANVLAGTSGELTCTLEGFEWDPIQISAVTDNLTDQDFVANE